MTSPSTFREGLVLAAFAVLCAAAGITMMLDLAGSPATVPVADAVGFLRLWAGG